MSTGNEVTAHHHGRACFERERSNDGAFEVEWRSLIGGRVLGTSRNPTIETPGPIPVLAGERIIRSIVRRFQLETLHELSGLIFGRREESACLGQLGIDRIKADDPWPRSSQPFPHASLGRGRQRVNQRPADAQDRRRRPVHQKRIVTERRGWTRDGELHRSVHDPVVTTRRCLRPWPRRCLIGEAWQPDCHNWAEVVGSGATRRWSVASRADATRRRRSRPRTEG